MKSTILILIISISTAFTNYSKAQNEDINVIFQNFLKLYSTGDLVNAEDVLLSVLDSKKSIPEEFMVAIYNNLGAINTMMGRYGKALEYYNKAESLIIEKNQDSQAFADICNNKAFIYNIQKSFGLAIEILDKSIRVYKNLNKTETKSVLQSLSSAYLNIGITYYEIKDFKTAAEYLKKSSELKLEHKLTGLPLVYLNIAKTFVKTENPIKAEEYYLKSISGFKTEFGEEYYRMADVEFDYSIFLSSVGRNIESLEALQKALSICLKNYSEKGTLVSLSYKLIGDHYVNQNDCDSALFYYQKSLIAVVNDFNDPDIFANPSIDSVIFDIRLLDNLKSKAQALELLSEQQNDGKLKLKTLHKSLETIELAMQLIDRIRNNYLSEESRIYLAENEKETYIFATHLAYSFFKLTNENSAAVKMYDMGKKAKTAILRNEITENELFYSTGIPDSLRTRQNKLSGNIAAYNNLILQEMRKKDPDIKKISLWKDALFEMNREKEMVVKAINREFPQYNDLLQKTEPVTLSEIQRQLRKDEIIIDYLLSNQYKDGKRKMYIFLISKNRLAFRETGLDSLFSKNVDIIRKLHQNTQSAAESGDSFKSYTAALFYMYDNLIKPVEEFLSGNRLIIIPDEEIALLTFDAFLKSKPSHDQTDYEGLQYLIYDYTFSYRYFYSLKVRSVPELKRVEDVYAFSPDYGNNGLSGMAQDYLQGAGNEIDAIFKLFSGKIFTGDKATESNFREAMQNPAIFHLSMHSLSDSANSRYSFMKFAPETDSMNDGKLYNYEISISRIKSPMVVLSACNSGTGTLYHGEGLMSLARGFILAGASSVVKTAWEVNDEASAAIITRFYFQLSKGKPKDVAMRLAKLEYLKTSPPVYNNPYYWAAYEVMGDNSPVDRNNRNLVLIIISLILIVIAALLITYFKRRRIFSDRSL